MTHRSIGLIIVLTIITCGIYGIYWFITLTNDSNVASGLSFFPGGKTFAVIRNIPYFSFLAP